MRKEDVNNKSSISSKSSSIDTKATYKHKKTTDKRINDGEKEVTGKIHASVQSVVLSKPCIIPLYHIYICHIFYLQIKILAFNKLFGGKLNTKIVRHRIPQRNLFVLINPTRSIQPGQSNPAKPNKSTQPNRT